MAVNGSYCVGTGIFVLNAVFFFSSRRRHTRCSRDWSSDVCSSDLGAVRFTSSSNFTPIEETSDAMWQLLLDVNLTAPMRLCRAVVPIMLEAGAGSKIGRGACRERGEISVVAVFLKKKPCLLGTGRG